MSACAVGCEYCADGFPPTGGYRDADHIIERARLERCQLAFYWHEAAALPPEEQVKVARALESIEPFRFASGTRCEPKWHFGRNARRRVRSAFEALAEALAEAQVVPQRTSKTAPKEPLEQAVSVTVQRGVLCRECGIPLKGHPRALYCGPKCRKRAQRRQRNA